MGSAPGKRLGTPGETWKLPVGVREFSLEHQREILTFGSLSTGRLNHNEKADPFRREIKLCWQNRSG
jgi:hypothetical protein